MTFGGRACVTSEDTMTLKRKKIAPILSWFICCPAPMAL